MLEELKNKKVEITLPDGRKIITNYKTKIEEILDENIDDKTKEKIIAVMVDNEVKTIDYHVLKNCKIEYIKYDSNDGYRIYSRTVKFILYMALHRLYPELQIEFSNNMETVSYFTCKNMKITKEMIESIKKEMDSIIARRSPIERKVVSSEEAEVIYKIMGNEEHLESLESRLKSYSTVCCCENIYNYMHGALATNTSCIKSYDMQRYRDGFILVMPIRDDVNKLPDKLEYNKLFEVFERFDKYNDIMQVEDVNKLNEKVINKEIGPIIRASETLHEKQMIELVDIINSRGKVKMLLIAGPSSSGKTTFAQKLGDNLQILGYNPIVISMDNYYKSREENFDKETGEYDFESITSLDVGLFNSQMKALTEGEEVELPRYDFMLGRKVYDGHRLKLKEKDILIVEGIHALNDVMTRQVEDKYKFKIYIAPLTTLNIDSYTKVSSTDTRMLRRIVRDYNIRGVKVEETLEMWDKIKKGEEKNIYPSINSSDYIYNSSLIYEIGVIKTFAEPLLLQIDRNSKYFSEARRLYEFLSNFLPIETKEISVNSIIREFIGDGSFSR